jgi:hypothetical protein
MTWDTFENTSPIECKMLEQKKMIALNVNNQNNMPDLVQNNFLLDILTIMLLFHQNDIYVSFVWSHSGPLLIHDLSPSL